jgi:Lanthionine synthetase C-like protein/Protein tyrosine and serine/threonine kinase/WWE domain
VWNGSAGVAYALYRCALTLAKEGVALGAPEARGDGSPQWEFQDSRAAWHPFDLYAGQVVESAFAFGDASVTLAHDFSGSAKRGVAYVFDLVSMEQTNLDSKHVRPIRRILATGGPSRVPGQTALLVATGAGPLLQRAAVANLAGDKKPAHARTIVTALMGAPGALMLPDFDSAHPIGASQSILDRVKHLLDLTDVVLASSSEDELLYGRAGFLTALISLFLEANQNGSLNVMVMKSLKKLARRIVSILIQEGRKTSARARKRKPQLHFPNLLCSWSHSFYIGPAHGFSGIAHQILVARRCGLVELAEDELADLQHSLDFLVEFPLLGDHFPPVIPMEYESDLVQWCHGWPGIILCVCEGLRHFRLPPLQLAAWISFLRRGSDAVWADGLLTKGVSLCHGVAGNGYAFLRIHETMQHLGERLADPAMLGDASKSLWRARCFLAFGIEMAKGDLSKRKFEVLRSLKGFTARSGPMSLYEGLSGLIVFACDVFAPRDCAFPFFEVSGAISMLESEPYQTPDLGTDESNSVQEGRRHHVSGEGQAVARDPVDFRLRVLVSDKKFIWRGSANSVADICSQLSERFGKLLSKVPNPPVVVDIQEFDEYFEIGEPEFDELCSAEAIRVRLSDWSTKGATETEAAGRAGLVAILSERGVPVLPPNTVEVGEQIGSGAFGFVYAGHLKTHMNETVALKQVRGRGWSEDASEHERAAVADLCTEAAVLWHHPHLNIVRLYGAHFDLGGSFYLVMEYCNKGSLESLVRSDFQSLSDRAADSGTSGYVDEDGVESPEVHPDLNCDTLPQEDTGRREVDIRLLLRLAKHITQGMHCLHSHDIAHRFVASTHELWLPF